MKLKQFLERAKLASTESQVETLGEELQQTLDKYKVLSPMRAAEIDAGIVGAKAYIKLAFDRVISAQYALRFELRFEVDEFTLSSELVHFRDKRGRGSQDYEFLQGGSFVIEPTTSFLGIAKTAMKQILNQQIELLILAGLPPDMAEKLAPKVLRS